MKKPKKPSGLKNIDWKGMPQRMAEAAARWDAMRSVDAEKAKADREVQLRETFAACAISCFYVEEKDVAALQRGVPAQHDIVARFCWDLADAMMAERKRRMTT